MGSNGPSKVAAAIKRVESEIGQTQDPARRRELEEATKQLTVELEQQTALEQQRSAQEIELMSQLQTEQAKLNNLSSQLDALDKRLQQ